MKGIQTQRKHSKLTQQELADQLTEKGFKTDRSSVAKWETGEAVPRADKLPIIATILKCSIDALYSKEPAHGQAS